MMTRIKYRLNLACHFLRIDPSNVPTKKHELYLIYWDLFAEKVKMARSATSRLNLAKATTGMSQLTDAYLAVREHGYGEVIADDDYHLRVLQNYIGEANRIFGLHQYYLKKHDDAVIAEMERQLLQQIG